MKLPHTEGFILPHCKHCGEPMDTIVVFPHSNEFAPKCLGCNVMFAGHPIQQWCRENRDLLLPDPELVAFVREWARREHEGMARMIDDLQRPTLLRGDPASPGADRAPE